MKKIQLNQFKHFLFIINSVVVVLYLLYPLYLFSIFSNSATILVPNSAFAAIIVKGWLRRKQVHGQLKAWQKLSDNSEFVTFQTGILPPPLVSNPFPNGTCEKTVS